MEDPEQPPALLSESSKCFVLLHGRSDTGLSWNLSRWLCKSSFVLTKNDTEIIRLVAVETLELKE